MAKYRKKPVVVEAQQWFEPGHAELQSLRLQLAKYESWPDDLRTCGELSCEECNERTAALRVKLDQQRKRIEVLEAALRPFVERANRISVDLPDGALIHGVTMGHLRAAAAAMEGEMKTKAETPGRRIPKPPRSWDNGEIPYQPGDYWKDDADGSWHGCTPNGLECWFKNHHVEENEDGTIDVVSGPWGSNSILVNGNRPNVWHGCIKHGVWREF